MGAGLAATVTWVLGDGAWDWSSFPIALTLLLVIAAYHRPPDPTAQKWDAAARSAAFASVAALAVALLVAFPLQELIMTSATEATCRSEARDMFPDDTPTYERVLAEDCVAARTTQWLTAVWLVAAAALYLLDVRILRRYYHSPPAAPPPAQAPPGGGVPPAPRTGGGPTAMR